MGWSHHMRQPNTFDCSKVRNSEKLILEIQTIRVAKGLAAGLQPLRVVKMKVFHIMSCLRFKMATNVTFVLYYIYHSVCSHGLISPDETSVSCCSFVCAFDLSAQLQGRLSFPKEFKSPNSKHWKILFAIKGNICHYKNTVYQPIAHIVKCSNYSDCHFKIYIVPYMFSMIWISFGPPVSWSVLILKFHVIQQP